MFYAHFVLSKKGPLARIWLAAHWDKKLTKAHVFETNIESSVDGILQPKVKMALRTTGHLLLGVVRIYSRKAKYLLADCNEAFVKIKMAFRPGMVDLPEEHREAAMNAITLPEVFHDFNTAMTELNDIDIEAQFSLNQTRAEDITLREDYGSLQLVPPEDGFGDMVFDSESPDIMRDALSGGQSLDQSNLLFTDGVGMSSDIDRTKEPLPSTSRSIQDSSIDAQSHEDGFGASMGEEFGHAGGLFEGDLFSDVAPEPVPLSSSALDVPPPSAPQADSDDDMDHFDVGAPSPGHSSDGSRPASPVLPSGPGRSTPLAPPSPQLMPPPSVPSMPSMDMHETINEEGMGNGIPEPEQDQTTLLQNEEESFALAPIDTTALKGVTKAKRKRKLIVDEVKNISGEEMKNQLSDTTDIVTTLDLAPPTKRLMHWKETGGVEKLFALPSRHIPARTLFKNYQRHLTSRAFENEDFSALGPDLIPEQLCQPEETSVVADTSVAKRLTRKRKLQSDAFDAEPSKTPVHEPDMSEPLLSPMASSALHEAQDHFDYDHFSEVGDVLAPPATPGPEALLMEPPTPGLLPMTPGDELLGDLTHGLPMTPAGIQTSDMSPHPMASDLLQPPPMTPGHLQPSDISPSHLDTTRLQTGPLETGGMTPGDISHAMVAGLPMPQIPGDQVSSILDSTNRAHTELDSIQVTDLGYENQSMQMANMGYDELAGDQTPRPPINDNVPTPWHDDFDFPPSVGLTGEEQMVDETDEQFEERVLNKRAAQLFMSVKSKFHKQDCLYLSDMARNNNRKQAAQKFYSLLVLKKFQVLDISQDVPCGDIQVIKGPKFDNPTL